tara:strand:- start:3693 stop:4436 length:744 start_codon:yes stop_codon:yes gene_type:complete
MPLRSRNAFTIVEVLVAVAIIAVIMSLIAPSISAARRSGIDVASLANLRTHAQVATLYAGDYRDFAPFIADPDATQSVIRGGGTTVIIEYFDSGWAWAFALTDEYYGVGLQSALTEQEWGVFAIPRSMGPTYRYSPNFVTRPAFWNEHTRAAGQLGPTRLGDVRSPDAKAIFIEWDLERSLPWWTQDTIGHPHRFGFGFVDGSARRPDPGTLVRPYPRGEGTAHGAQFSLGIVGLHTVDGVLGRDVQ